MKAWRFTLLVILLCASACTPLFERLPAGITRIKGINRQGLGFPLWSPDGKQIAAAYNIYPMPDIGFGPAERHDIVMIDAQTRHVSVFATDNAEVSPAAWSPDSKRLAVALSGTWDTDGIYIIAADHPMRSYLSNSDLSNSPDATRLSEEGVLSPDLKRIARYDAPYIAISNIDGSDRQQFPLPAEKGWYPYSWSPDGRWLTLSYHSEQDAPFENLYLVDVNTGALAPFTSDTDYHNSLPRFAPSGELIAYFKGRYVENAWERKLIISRLDRRCQWTMPLNDVWSFAWSPDGRRMFIVGLDGVYLADLSAVFGSSYPSGQGCK